MNKVFTIARAGTGRTVAPGTDDASQAISRPALRAVPEARGVQPDRRPVLIQRQAVGSVNDAQALAQGLLQAPARIAPRFLYDALGARLFEAICELPEYYPTRTEAGILAEAAGEIAALTGPGRVLIDLGAGSCAKAQRLFPALQPAQYVAVDLDVALLEPALTAIQQRHPRLSVVGVGCDLACPLELPPVVDAGRLAFYPGSSIGNFEPAAAIALLARIRAAVQPDGWLLIGFDLRKPERWLRPAYDDALQVTAAFNRNVLRHVNRVLGSDFDLADWRHEVRCLPDRVQMHLQAQRAVSVRWADGARAFEAGEAIHTEDSFKYTVAGFTTMVERAGFHAVRCWTDPRQWFALMLARA